jgi:hypothetical protein
LEVGSPTFLALERQFTTRPRAPNFRLTTRLASARAKPHIGAMTMATNKKAASRRSDVPKRAVIYRGVKIIPKTGKRSPIAKVIRDGLRTKSEHSRGEAQT